MAIRDRLRVRPGPDAMRKSVMVQTGTVPPASKARAADALAGRQAVPNGPGPDEPEQAAPGLEQGAAQGMERQAPEGVAPEGSAPEGSLEEEDIGPSDDIDNLDGVQPALPRSQMGTPAAEDGHGHDIDLDQKEHNFDLHSFLKR